MLTEDFMSTPRATLWRSDNKYDTKLGEKKLYKQTNEYGIYTIKRMNGADFRKGSGRQATAS